MNRKFDSAAAAAAASFAVRSISYRLAHRDSVAKGCVIFTEPLEFVVGSPFLEVARVPPLRSDVECTQVYTRQSTSTYVNRLSAGTSIIVKAWAVARHKLRNTDADDGLLAEHEVEVRYLLLLTAMMQAGSIDAATIPIGSFICDGPTLCDTGVLLDAQRAAVKADDSLPRSKGQGPRQYALLFAESADGSLTDHLFHSETSDIDYWLRAALLQTCVALANIHATFPSFRHNDLHASNVLIQHLNPSEIRATLGNKLPAAEPLYVEYTLGEKRWQVDIERAPFRCLLWDFSFASISADDASRLGIHSHAAPRTTKFGSVVALSKTNCNQFVDIRQLVDTLRWVLKQNKTLWKHVSVKTSALLDQIVPDDMSWADKSIEDSVKAERQIKVTHGDLQHSSPTMLLLWTDAFDEFCTKTKVRPVYRVAPVKAGTRDIFEEFLKSPSIFSSK